MYQSKIEDYKVEIIRLNDEIQNQKSKYYEQKKKYDNLNRKFEINTKYEIKIILIKKNIN